MLLFAWMAPAVRRQMAVMLLVLAAGMPAAPIIETGEIEGAKFMLARPERWNGMVLLLAHGYRAEDRPLVADLFPDQLSRRALLAEGWIVAKTSYRRNGIIIADAIADLDALRAHIARQFGRPQRVILEGESMGGLIVTLIAEREPAAPRLYSGAIAIGAALHIKEANSPLGLSMQPKIPLLFLANQSEMEAPRLYVTADIGRSPSLRPALFRIARHGHVNVNQPERLAALRALNAWLDRGRAALPPTAADAPFFDATVPPTTQPSQVTLHGDRRGFDARVILISAVYGNVFINAQPADFAAAGIGGMTYLQLVTPAKTYRLRFARDFADVPRGDWVVFPNADGFCWLARNRADAAATAGLSVGDTVTLRRYDPPSP
jgi:pimeloyl-ACP methyl ester carboxylesterase